MKSRWFGALVLALVAACMRRQVRWELPTGFPAVALCDGGALVDEDETSGGSGGGQSDGVIPARDANPCMKLLTREYGYDWEERTFLFEFSTDDAGVVTHVCAIQVPSAPQSATCAADLVERTRFDPGITRGRYRFRFFID